MAEEFGPTKHAYLGPSSAVRWMAVPPIVQLETDVPRKDTAYTLEGTDAHTLAEFKLQHFISPYEDYEAKHNEVIGNLTYYDQEMEEYTSQYADLVIEHFNAYENARMELEVQVDISKWVPDSFGTSDVVIISDGVIEVIDLKYGKGVPVDAYQNPQLMLYALGAYDRYDLLYDFDRIRMTIVQPRLDNVSTFEIEVEELLYWANNYVAPRAVYAFEGIGEWNLKADVLRFSPVRATLRPRAEKNFEIIEKYDFKENALLDYEEIAEILAQAKEIKSWLDDVENYALHSALQGKEIPGWKLVEGRSNRVITDKSELEVRLMMEGYEADKILKPKELLALGALEKAVGKSNFAKIAEGLIIKPTGKPVLAPAKDKRPAINSEASAQDDFAEL